MSESQILESWLENIAAARIPANNNVRALQAYVLSSAISATTTAQPSLPATADDPPVVYIIPAAATGAVWSTFAEGDVAIGYFEGWTAYAPYEGLRKTVLDEGTDGENWQYLDGAWAPEAGASGVTASDVAVVDTGGYFTGTNVEAVLQEVGAALATTAASIGVQYESDTGSTADSDPGPGLLKWNNATQASATQLYLDDASVDGASLTGFWSALIAGGFAYLQHATDQDVWQIWEIDTVTDATGYVKLAVTLLAKGTDFADGDPMLVTLEQGAASGGGGDFVGPASAVDSNLVAFDTSSGKLGKDSGSSVAKLRTQSIQIACSDLTTNITTGTGKAYFRMPYAFTLTAVRASVFVAQTAGSILTFDINEGGTTILSTKLTIDNSEKTSTTAATPAVISDTSLADDAEITIDFDQVGTALAKGVVITLIGYQT